jgi:hypothetical protein
MTRRRRRPATTTIDRALLDPNLLGAALGDSASWTRWLIVLKAAFGLPLSEAQRQQFIEVAGGREPPSRRVRELWAVVSRRCGKSRMAAGLAVFAACFTQHRLAPGETGMVLVLAASQSQAKVVFQYVLGFITSSPVLRQELVSTTRSEIRLRNGVVIAIHSNSFRLIRGRTILAAVLDECAFWRSEDSAQPDTETYTALLPSLATTNGLLVGISTPYRKLGLLHQKHRDHFGQEDPDVLVVQGTHAQFNPTLSESTVAAQRQADPQGAVSEWDAEFRSDISAFLSDELIEASINYGRPLELPPQSGMVYKAFCDPSGGRGDAYTVAVGHRQQGRLVIDCVRGVHVPLGQHSFDPMAATKAFADLLKHYRVGSVVADGYSAEWAREAWRKHGVSYLKSELTKSEIYLEVLSLFTRGLVSLPDHPRLLKELRLLERRVHRSGKDSVDHGRSGNDDYANAACGVLRRLAATANFDAWDAAYGDAAEQPSEPEPFKHAQAEAREYWQGLAAQIHAYSGGRYWPT